MRPLCKRALFFCVAAAIAAVPVARADEPAPGAAGQTGPTGDSAAGTSAFGFHGPFGGIRLRWSDDGSLPGFTPDPSGDSSEFVPVDSTDQATSVVGGYRGFTFLRAPTLIAGDTMGEGESDSGPSRLIPAGVFFLGDAHAAASIGSAETADQERGGATYGVLGNGLALVGVSSQSDDGCGFTTSMGVEGEVDLTSAWHGRDQRATAEVRGAPVGLLCAGRSAAIFLNPYVAIGGGMVGGDARGTHAYGADLTFMLPSGRLRLEASREAVFGEGPGRTRFLASSAGRITPSLALGVDGSVAIVSDRATAVTGDAVRSMDISLLGTLVYTPGATSGR